MPDREQIFIFGASGHAKVVVDIIEQSEDYSISWLLDDNPQLKGNIFFGYPVAGGRSDLEIISATTQLGKGLVAIGINSVRQSVAAWLAEKGIGFITAIHPSARIARGVTISSGTAVMANAVINSDTSIGKHVIINTSASIDHDCMIGDGVHIAPGATLCGSVSLGRNSMVGAGSIIIPNLKIGESVVIGAGSTVISNLPDNVTAVGSPARIIKQ